METTSSIDFNFQLSAQVAGDAPVRGGRISFPVSMSGNVPCADGMVCRRILADDLIQDGGAYYFKIYLGATNLVTDAQDPMLNNAGDPIPNITDAVFFYLRSNKEIESVYCSFSTPNFMEADDFMVLKMPFGINATNPGDEVVSLGWALAEVDANPSAFYCDLILAPATV